MALQTYDDLRQAIINWPDLSGETDLESHVDLLISLGEARINVALRLRQSLKTYTSPDESVTSAQLPSDFLEVDQVTDTGGNSLVYADVDKINTLVGANDCLYYSIDGDHLVFSSTVDGYLLRYYPRLEPLSQTDTNWLYRLSPGLYLYSALIDAAIFSKESEQETSRYNAAFNEAAGQLSALDGNQLFPKSQPITSTRRGYRNGT